MSRGTQPAALTGRATVKLKTGATYVGWVIYDGRMVTIEDGRLRVVSLVRGRQTVTYRGAARRRTFAWHLVEHVLWDVVDASVA
jgi:hypothetical protein